MCETKTNSRIGNSYIKEELKSKCPTKWVISPCDYLPYNFTYNSPYDSSKTINYKKKEESIGVVTKEDVPNKEEIGKCNYKNYSDSYLVDNVVKNREYLVKAYAVILSAHLNHNEHIPTLKIMCEALGGIKEVQKRLRKSLKELKRRGADIYEIQKEVSFKYPKKDIENALIIIGDWIKENS